MRNHDRATGGLAVASPRTAAVGQVQPQTKQALQCPRVGQMPGAGVGITIRPHGVEGGPHKGTDVGVQPGIDVQVALVVPEGGEPLSGIVGVVAGGACAVARTFGDVIVAGIRRRMDTRTSTGGLGLFGLGVLVEDPLGLCGRAGCGDQVDVGLVGGSCHLHGVAERPDREPPLRKGTEQDRQPLTAINETCACPGLDQGETCLQGEPMLQGANSCTSPSVAGVKRSEQVDQFGLCSMDGARRAWELALRSTW